MPVEAVVETVTEEVASNLEEIATATRRINPRSVGFFVGGLAVGAVAGFYVGRKFMKEKIKAEAFAKSEEEVAKIREVYQQKTVAAKPKPAVEDVVEGLGYDRPLKPPVPISGVPGLVGRPPVPVVVVDPDKPVWDYPKELEGRLSGEPYVIHQDEFMSRQTGYRHVTYTYYALDNVLVDDENEHPLPHADIIVGLNNLQFGHGTDDADVVFVRNDERELEMEICRVNKSYEEEVLGIENSGEPDDDDD